MKERDTDEPQEAAVCQCARHLFFQDHLSWWAPSFSLALRRKAEYGFYAEVAKALSAFLPVVRQRQGIAAPLMPLEAKVTEATESCAGCPHAANG